MKFGSPWEPLRQNKSFAAKVSRFFILFLLLTIISLLRIRNSFDRMAPDPGFWFLEQVRNNNFLHVLSNQDGFLHLAPRFSFEFVSLFPIKYQAIAGTIGMQFVFAAVGIAVFYIVQLEAKQFWLAFIAASMVVAVPSAAESTVGNLGSVKWPLTILLAFILASATTMRRYPNLAIGSALFIGLSQPYSIVLLVPVCVKKFMTNSKVVFTKAECCVVVTSVVQGLIWVTSGVGLQKYGEPTYFAWSGMGIFWYSIWLTPTLTGVLILLFLFFFRKRVNVGSAFETRLASASVLLALVSYLQLGIKDSSSVAPQAISWVALLLTVSKLDGLFGRKTAKFGMMLVLVISLTASVKWFNASWYLTSGPTWSSEIERARNECEQYDRNEVDVKQFMGDTTFDCKQLFGGS